VWTRPLENPGRFARKTEGKEFRKQVEMCGFAGISSLGRSGAGRRPQRRAAANVLAHRWRIRPDSGTIAHISLGFPGLKIIDLSPAGEQPMANETARCALSSMAKSTTTRELATKTVFARTRF